jgi:hypothetical protein
VALSEMGGYAAPLQVAEGETWPATAQRSAAVVHCCFLGGRSQVAGRWSQVAGRRSSGGAPRQCARGLYALPPSAERKPCYVPASDARWSIARRLPVFPFAVEPGTYILNHRVYRTWVDRWPSMVDDDEAHPWFKKIRVYALLALSRGVRTRVGGL